MICSYIKKRVQQMQGYEVFEDSVKNNSNIIWCIVHLNQKLWVNYICLFVFHFHIRQPVSIQAAVGEKPHVPKEREFSIHIYLCSKTSKRHFYSSFCEISLYPPELGK